MPKRWPDDDLEKQMIADADWIATAGNLPHPLGVAGDIRCHVMALLERVRVLEESLDVATGRAQRFRDTLLRIAARADDYSGPCIRAHVADALEMTVEDLEALLESDDG